MKISEERKLKLIEEDENLYEEYYIFHFSDIDFSLEECCRQNFYNYFVGHPAKQENVNYFISDYKNSFLKKK